MFHGYTPQVCMQNKLRLLWSQHVYWTRMFIISTVAELSDSNEVTERLLRNPKGFARLLSPVFGEKSAAKFDELLTEHLKIGGDLVNAAKNHEVSKANELRKQWYENVDEIACFLQSQSNCWQACKWKSMLYSHLDMTEKEAGLRINGNYAADIKMFDEIEAQALKMADYMLCGIANSHK